MPQLSMNPAKYPVRVAAAVPEGRDVLAIDLVADGAAGLPAWSPGDHIDVLTSVGLRQYSLCGPLQAAHWRIGVRRAAGHRGVSDWLHRNAEVGLELNVGAPRSTFALRRAREYVFVAGGIGITPLLPMIEKAERDGVPWRLLYTARACHAFRSQLPTDERVRLWSSDADGRLDVGAELDVIDPSAAVYCCGPPALTDMVVAHTRQRGLADRVFIERFVAAEPALLSENREFEIELADTGTILSVPAHRTALDVLNEAGVFVPSSCRAGICGSCEVAVVAGDVEHRDSVLSEAERTESTESTSFFPCVSRARGLRIVVAT